MIMCNAAATLNHAFVTSRLDHCCLILVGLSFALVTRFHRVFVMLLVLLGASRNMPLSQHTVYVGLWHSALVAVYLPMFSNKTKIYNWLPVAHYNIVVLVWQCLLGSARHTYVSSVVRYLRYPAMEPFILPLLANVLILVFLSLLVSVVHSQLSVPPSIMEPIIEMRLLSRSIANAFYNLQVA